MAGSLDVHRYTPGQAADASGLSLDTLRYYDRIGLLDDLARTPGGQRVFTEQDLAWLGILRCLRRTGMPIAVLRRYAELARQGDATASERLALLEEHDRSVDRQIAELHEQQQRLREKISFYRSVQERRAASVRPAPEQGGHGPGEPL